MKSHKHAELIKAWADGAVIEWKDSFGDWHSVGKPRWESEDFEFRIKPEPKPDWIQYLVNTSEGWIAFNNLEMPWENVVKVIRDGETGELKSAEVLK